MGKGINTRACGILLEDERVLLVRHEGYGDGFLWIPPGGGIEPGERIRDTVEREFMEEVSLKVRPLGHVCSNEVITTSLHAIEFFVLVERLDGSPRLGSDPEFGPEQQIISDWGWFDAEKLSQIPRANKHNIFHGLDSLSSIADSRYYHRSLVERFPRSDLSGAQAGGVDVKTQIKQT